MDSKEYQHAYYLANREKKKAALTPEQVEKRRAYCRAYSRERWARFGRDEEGKKRAREANKRWHEKNRERLLEYSRNYYRTHRVRHREAQIEWNKKNRDRRIAAGKAWRLRNLDHQHEKERELRRKRKLEVIAAYGGSCSCCGESRFEFLSVDHVGGRKTHGHSKSMAGIKLYAWLRRHGYPQEGFRCLCLNCNTSYGFYGYCPHERERQQRAAAD